jgi:hypothetical protein
MGLEGHRIATDKFLVITMTAEEVWEVQSVVWLFYLLHGCWAWVVEGAAYRHRTVRVGPLDWCGRKRTAKSVALVVTTYWIWARRRIVNQASSNYSMSIFCHYIPPLIRCYGGTWLEQTIKSHRCENYRAVCVIILDTRLRGLIF